MEHIWKGVLIVGLLLLVVAVFQPSLTGHVTKEYDEYLLEEKYSDTQEYELEKAQESIEAEYTQEQMEADVKQAKTFFKFVSLFFQDESEGVAESGGCCTDVTALQQKVAELESKVKQLEQRNSQSCQLVRITSGSCQSACQAKSLRCTAATNTRMLTEHPIIGSSYQTEVFSHPVACEYNWYMPGNPDLKDTMECSCC